MDFLKNANVGECIEFGNYPQSADGDIKHIEWLILVRTKKQGLVISRYGLDAKRFDSSSNNWRNSEIRKWLNGEFYNKAFTDQEKKSINFSNLSDVGTEDNVFLLSKEEAEKYFANDKEIICKPTEYALERGAFVTNNGFSFWLLRSPYPNYNYGVYDVSFDGFITYTDVNFDINLVRPALWINL